MKQLSAVEKKKLGMPLVDSATKRWIKRRMLPIILKMAQSTIKYEVISNSICKPVPAKPIIYAMNHSEINDFPILCNNINTDCYILAGKQSLDFGGSLFFSVHGVIYFDRTDKAEMAAAKEEILAYLEKGIGIIWAPEGTWNLSENLPMLPMRWGIIDVACQANAQIIPVVMNYDRENMKCCIDWGMPIHGEMLNDKAKAINQLRDCMASFRWEAWDKAPHLKRSEFDKTGFKAEFDALMEEYPADQEIEQSIIFHPYTDPAEAFAHLANLIPKRENAFLYNKRLPGSNLWEEMENST